MSFPSVAPGQPTDWRRLLELFGSHFDELQRVEVLGVRYSGDDVVVRYLASRATEHVVEHIQHDGTGGGGETYTVGTYVTRTRADCRADRQQEVTITRSSDDSFALWLIPSLLLADGTTYVDWDGEGVTTDYMAFLALGSYLDRLAGGGFDYGFDKGFES